MFLRGFLVASVLASAAARADLTDSHAVVPPSPGNRRQLADGARTRESFESFASARETENPLMEVRKADDPPKKALSEELKQRLSKLDTKATELAKTKEGVIELLKERTKNAKFGNTPMKVTDFPQYLRILSDSEQSALTGDFLVIADASFNTFYVLNTKTNELKAWEGDQVKYVGLDKEGRILVAGGNRGTIAKTFVFTPGADTQILAKTDSRFTYADGEAAYDGKPLKKLFGPKPGVSLSDVGK